MFKKSIAAQRPFKLALIASIALLGAASTPSFAATTATSTASATVITPISVAASGTLAFGKFSPGGSTGTVTVNTAGVVSKTGGAILAGGTPSAVTFTVTGEKSAGYTIDTSATDINLTSGTDTMALTLVDDFTGAGATTGAQTTGTLDATTGTQVLHMGGTLAVSATQPAGSYVGNLSVAVAYQ